MWASMPTSRTSPPSKSSRCWSRNAVANPPCRASSAHAKPSPPIPSTPPPTPHRNPPGAGRAPPWRTRRAAPAARTRSLPAPWHRRRHAPAAKLERRRHQRRKRRARIVIDPQAVLLEAGLVVDGSGGPAWPGDVLLQGDRILALGEGLRGRLPEGLGVVDLDIVDCRAKVIAPGFIDAQTHDDAIVLRDPLCLPKVSQGITTVVTGNCGISLAPYRTPQSKPPLTLLGADSFRHATMAEYRAAVDATQPALNVAALVGHTTLRFATMQALDRPASGDELARMEALLDSSMADGAHGMSSGLFYEEAFAAPAPQLTTLPPITPPHPPPSQEFPAPARVGARRGGVFAPHLRSEMQQLIEALHEAGESAFNAGVP